MMAELFNKILLINAEGRFFPLSPSICHPPFKNSSSSSVYRYEYLCLLPHSSPAPLLRRPRHNLPEWPQPSPQPSRYRYCYCWESPPRIRTWVILPHIASNHARPTPNANHRARQFEATRDTLRLGGVGKTYRSCGTRTTILAGYTGAH